MRVLDLNQRWWRLMRPHWWPGPTRNNIWSVREDLNLWPLGSRPRTLLDWATNRKYWSGYQESNLSFKLPKLVDYHYLIPWKLSRSIFIFTEDRAPCETNQSLIGLITSFDAYAARTWWVTRRIKLPYCGHCYWPLSFQHQEIVSTYPLIISPHLS